MLRKQLEGLIFYLPSITMRFRNAMMSKWTGNAPECQLRGRLYSSNRSFTAHTFCYREAKLRVFLFPFFRFEFIADKCPCHKQ